MVNSGENNVIDRRNKEILGRAREGALAQIIAKREGKSYNFSWLSKEIARCPLLVEKQTSDRASDRQHRSRFGLVLFLLEVHFANYTS